MTPAKEIISERELLVARCAELLEWSRTGLLAGGEGGVVRDLAAELEKNVGESYALRVAEDQIKMDAMREIVRLAGDAPVAWRSRHANGKKWVYLDYEPTPWQYRIVEPLYVAPVDRHVLRLGDIVEVREGSSSFAGDWQRVHLKVVGLHVEPNGSMWADVIEGDARHRGNGRYDGETTGFDCDHLSLVTRPDGMTQSSAPETEGR